MSVEMVLFRNLVKRFEYNKHTELYVLRGSVTKDEYRAMTDAMRTLERVTRGET